MEDNTKRLLDYVEKLDIEKIIDYKFDDAEEIYTKHKPSFPEKPTSKSILKSKKKPKITIR